MSEINLDVFISKVKEIADVDELDAVRDDPELFEELAEKVGKLPPPAIALAVKEVVRQACGESVQSPKDSLTAMGELAAADRLTGPWDYCENPHADVLRIRALKAVRNLLLFKNNENEVRRILNELDYPELILTAYLYHILKNIFPS